MLARVAVVILLLGSVGRALAEEPPVAGAEAEAKFLEGVKSFDVADYDRAIEAFKAAYRLDPQPKYLWSTAQAYRLKGDCAQAYLVYKSFQRVAPAEMAAKAKLDALIRSMDECRKKQVPVEEPVVVARPAPAPVPAPPTPEPRRPGRGWKIAGVALGSLGLALAGTGVYFGLQARARAQDVEDYLAANLVWSEEAEELEREGERFETISLVLVGAGAAALVGGGVCYWLGVRADSAARISVAPTRGGAVVGFAWAF